MARGRKRKHNPTIPAHIDQTRLPPGIYWDKSGKGRWYVLEPHPEGGRRRAVTVAGPAARLSDLHAIMEQRAGGDARGTIGYLMTLFKGSTDYRGLSPSTQDDYDYCARVVRRHKTPMGVTLDALYVDRLTTPAIQRLVESIASGNPERGIPGYPTKANKLVRYLGRLFAWGMRHGHCTRNPVRGVQKVAELKRSRMPEHITYAKVLAFARERGARKAHTAGSCPPYLWCVMEIAYLCRMRGIEVVQLTDAHATAEGLRVRRVKGSRDNVVMWNARLRAAWEGALAVRAAVHARPKNRGRAVPIRPDERAVFVNQSGAPLSKGALDQAWQDLMRLAVKEGVITREERFTLHGLKHRGITDTKGDKKLASGHKSDAMLARYDHEIPTVEAADAPEFSGEFSGAGDRGPASR